MPRVRLTRAVRFSAAHRYYRPEWDDERNRAEFGACANEHGHGHDYRCLVTIEGEPSASTSMVMNLTDLDGILREQIAVPLDHRHLNIEVPEFAFGRTVPTAEALAQWIWGRVADALPSSVRLVRIRVIESEDLWADYRGD